MYKLIYGWLEPIGLSASNTTALAWLATGIAVVVLALVANYIAKKVLLAGVSVFVRKSRTNWDDALMRRKVFTHLSHVAPALVIYYTAPAFGDVGDVLQRLSMIYITLIGLMVVYSFLNAVNDIYCNYEISRQRPIKGYLQVIQIILTIFVVISIIATLFDRPIWPLITGLGAMTAVLILVFKDSILGLVASILISTNDMVRIGDWIEMPQYGADGDVVDISLTTVKVQNWDKTIATIPTYALISDSFKNWRGMSESGGRRIKRAIRIDMNSIKFCDPAMLDRFEKYQLITDYVKSRRQEIAEYNETHKIDASYLVNGRNMTNVGTFRAYIAAYLKKHPKIHQEMTFLIRHLPPGRDGLPIEIYVFSNDQVWANYEAIQADIFDHILAVLPYFDLTIFQDPTGRDIRMLSGSKSIESKL
jgi:miniconductance mechanosensitive channel